LREIIFIILFIVEGLIVEIRVVVGIWLREIIIGSWGFEKLELSELVWVT
jgi:hypothetical protein